MQMSPSLPLTGVRVIELTEGPADFTGRYLADLGAEVIKVEPPNGGPSRREAPLLDGVSLPFAARNANKQSVIIDLAEPAGPPRLLELVEGADIWIEATPRGWL